MLSLKNLSGGSAKSVTRYAEHEKDKDSSVGYYEQASGGAPSQWLGGGASALGLSGRVNAADLERLLEGRIDAEATLTAAGKERRMGVDLTFSAPKSVSIAGLAGDDERILVAHDNAVREAMKYIESDVAGARRGHGGAEREATNSIIAAVYRHEDARPVDGHVDPQIHSHAILVNATQRADGKWAAVNLDFGAQAERMHTADAIYKSSLEREMRGLGYDTRRTENGFELAAISDEQIERFSARRNQIDAALEGEGKTRKESSATDRSRLNLATRESKTQASKSEQRWRWLEDGRNAGLNLDALRASARSKNPQARRDLSADAVRAAVRHVSERDTVFSADAVELEAVRAGGGSATLDSVRAEIAKGTGGLLAAGTDDQGRQRYTTAAALARERAILSRAAAGIDTQDSVMSDAAQAAHFVKLWERKNGMKLTQGQASAVDLILTSTDRAVGIVGAAGAGKTTAMKAVVDAARSENIEIIGLAPTTKAVRELSSAGVSPRTIARWLHDPTPAGNEMILIDEAGMISARDMQHIMQRAETTGSRVVLVGDPEQIQSVEAGTPFRQMLETKAIKRANIDEIVRQRDPALREIAQKFARGDAAGAVEKAKPYMHEVSVVGGGEGKRPSADERRAAIAAGAARSYLNLSAEKQQKTLVLAGTNEVRKQINERIRNGLDLTRSNQESHNTITAIDKADLTREHATRAEFYKNGMIVAVSEGKGEDRRIEHYKVIGRGEKNAVLLRASDGKERQINPALDRARGVYKPREMKLAGGDKIMFREPTGSAKDVGGRVENGAIATVTSIDKSRSEAHVKLEDGREKTLDLTKPQAVDYGWARTIHSSQGATVDHVIVAGEASRVATAETAYVAASRERESLTIITDDKERLAAAWAKKAERQIASEVAQDSPRGGKLNELRKDLGRAGDLARAREDASEIERRKQQEQKRERGIGHERGIER